MNSKQRRQKLNVLDVVMTPNGEATVFEIMEYSSVVSVISEDWVIDPVRVFPRHEITLLQKEQ